MPAWVRRLRARLKYHRFDADVAREIDAHRAMKQAELETRGLPAIEARAAAARALGNVVFMREDARGVWLRPWLESAWRDVWHATRGFARQPAFSVSAMLVLAVGVGSLTIAFSFLNAALLRPWPIRDPGAVVVLKARTGPQLDLRNVRLDEAQYLQEHTRTLSGVGAYTRGREPLGPNGPRVSTCFVTSTFFDVLQVRMAIGRGFTPRDGRDLPATVAVISERIWRTQFNGDPAIVGRTVRIRDRPFEIVGVAEAGFQGIDPIQIGVWLPLPAFRLLNGMADAEPVAVQWVFGRMKAGVGRAEARAELDGLSRQFRQAVPMPSYGLEVTSTRPIGAAGDRTSEILRAFALIFAGLGLVLLLTCSNVGSLLLARAIARQREVAVRLCLGADWKRVARQFFTETLVLALGAGCLGLVILSAGATLLADGGLDFHTEFVAPDGLVFLFSLVVCTLAAAMASGVTVLYIARFNIAGATARRHGPDVRTARARGALLAVQIAVSAVLLTGGSLLTRAALRAASADPGFAVENVHSLRMQASGMSPQRRVAVADAIQKELERQQIPNVAFASEPPILNFPGSTIRVRLPHEPAGTGRAFAHRRVSANYFDVLDIALVAGRAPRPDSQGREVVVNAQMARRLWPDGPATGRELATQAADKSLTVLTVVGVAEDVPISTLGQIEPVVYSVGSGRAEILARDLSRETLERIRAIATTLEPSVRMTADPLRDDIAAGAAGKTEDVRNIAWMVGAGALALSMIGAFGLFAYTVEERRREIGIRLALGGRAGQVTRAVLQSALRPSVVGAAVGFLVSAGAATVMRSEVYGLQPFDTLAYVQVAGVLAAATALAALIPARRAARVDPAVTLRAD